MSNVVTDQLKTILEVTKKALKTSQRIEQVQDQDREDFHSLVNRVGHLEVEVKSLKDVVSKLPGLTQNQVAEAVVPVINEAHDLKETIEAKKTLSITPKKKSLLKKIFRR